MSRLIQICLLCVMWLLVAPQAQAQIGLPTAAVPEAAAPVLPNPLTPEAANALISRLSDSEVRALLIDQLNTQALATEAEQDDGTSDFLYHATSGAWSSVVVPFQRIGNLFSGQSRAFSNFYEKVGHGQGLLVMLGYMILVFGAGGLAELAFRRFTSGWRILPPADPENMTLRETLQLLAQRFGTQVVAVLIFILVARIVNHSIVPEMLLPTVQLVGIYLIAFPRLMLAVAFFFFAPLNPEYRLLNLATPAAKAFCFHQFWLAMLLGFSAAIQVFNAANGVPAGETRIAFWLNLAMHIYLIVIFWKYRADGVTMMRGADPDVTPAEERTAQMYPYFNIFMFVAVWWIINIVVSYGNFDLLRSAPHYKTMILLMFAPAMDTAIRGLVRHLTPAMSGEGPVAEKAYYATKRSYIRIGRVVIFAGVIMAIAEFWGMSPTAIATAGIGARLAANGMEFLIILSIGYILYEAVSLFINRKLAAEYTASGYNPDSEEIGGGDGGGAGGSRLSTVLPLILMVSRAAIVVIFLLLALGNIGVDTTPLLAGAGIVGLAIGFGAQKLVSDVVSGIFFLIDDAFRTGEYVEVEGTMGTVEKISIRSMQLRHHKGPVHTIPYGEIPKVTNFSRDWVIMKLRFTVPFNSDPNKIKKIFKKIGQEMLVMEEFKDDFLAPFKSQGVLEIDDVGMVIRGKFMCKPGTQFMIRKEIYNRVNAAFAEAGLEFARREVRVALPSMEQVTELSEEDKATISAAASQAAQEQSGVVPGKG
ncbi:mechanosensitive ion channel family protein [Sulfitobacter mediterraneus]|jgi:moderate conductance mechanosensitive channel|uniref:mechanosensitive ion channel family protein n=1 Tax=Sulfitobacter mediterraneus TaxID=83219 RepID=UPI0021A90DC1|nr:mechanosensitive ion channel family protein [Sulfitobacter mediterraneus]UWR11999.1 mechanosensitive ion channel family protein [Sulfitobacter mediterraneus]